MPDAGGGNRFEFWRRFPGAPSRHWRALAVAAILPVCAACWAKKEPESKPTEDPRLVGRIASIPPHRRFVLIHSYGKWDITAGTILTTRGEDGRSANLLVTGESLGSFAAADLQSGQVELGDLVYSRHVPKPVQAAPSADSPAGPIAPGQEPEVAPEPELPADPAPGP